MSRVRLALGALAFLLLLTGLAAASGDWGGWGGGGYGDPDDDDDCNCSAAQVTYNNGTSGLGATNVQAAIDALAGQNATHAAQIAALQSQVASVQSQVGSLQSQVASLQSQVDGLSATVSAQGAQLAGHDALLASHTAALDAHATRLEELEASVIATSNDIVILSGVNYTYTVPAGKVLVVTNLRGPGSDQILIGGVRLANRSIGPSVVVVGEAESIIAPAGGGNTRISGYLLPLAKAPGTAVHLGPGTSYTVPTGKTLVLTSFFGGEGAEAIRVDGKPLTDTPLEGGENVNIRVAAGSTVTITAAPNRGYAHGYVK